MAIPLVYNSCFSETALDNAVADYLDVQSRLQEQEKLKQEWEDERQHERDEKERSGEPYEPEEKEWEEIAERPYDTEEESYVVCLDVLG